VVVERELPAKPSMIIEVKHGGPGVVFKNVAALGKEPHESAQKLLASEGSGK
jgi:hypothetical protein